MSCTRSPNGYLCRRVKQNVEPNVKPYRWKEAAGGRLHLDGNRGVDSGGGCACKKLSKGERVGSASAKVRVRRRPSQDNMAYPCGVCAKMRPLPPDGVPIVRTYRGFPAETAGMVGARRGSRGEIILGDVITEIDGERVANNDEFLSAMEKHRVGDTIDIVTTREGEEKRFTVELSEVQ